MNSVSDKVMTLPDAVRKYAFDGCHMSIGGFTINRNPMAAVYEIIRQRIRHVQVVEIDPIRPETLQTPPALTQDGLSVETWLPLGNARPIAAHLCGDLHLVAKRSDDTTQNLF